MEKEYNFKRGEKGQFLPSLKREGLLATKSMKFFWVDATLGNNRDERKNLITTALESGASSVVILEEDFEIAEKLGKVDLIVKESCRGKIALVGPPAQESLPEDISNSDIYRRAEELSKQCKVAGYVKISSKSHERLAAELSNVCSHIIVVGEDWKIIPLENLIAELQTEEVKVMAGVRDAEDAKLAFETLEVGVDGVLIQTQSFDEIKKVGEISHSASETLELKTGKVVRLEQVGLGDRVCVDTASLLNPGEGMLVGSQGSGLFLVHSETLESEYVASRPFRVNAGAVHAYILAPGMKTRYLSELEAGDVVLAVDSGGIAREVVVGRVKIEKRPLMLVEVETDGKKFKTLLQNAETVNLVTPQGNPVSVSKLKAGDEILIYAKNIGRHFGMEVEESIIEK